MPIFCFHCEKCELKFEELMRFKDIDTASCPKCNTSAKQIYPDTVHCAFTNPKDTSLWDNFGYRAGFNLEKAKQERRDAEAAQKGNPYSDVNDFDVRGAFDKGGADVQDTPGVTIPS